MRKTITWKPRRLRASSVGSAAHIRKAATSRPYWSLSLIHIYTLATSPQTSRVLRGWALLSRGTFSTAIFLIDVALIVATSFVTGIAYYSIAYGDIGNISSYVQVGVLAASIFAVSNIFRGEYRLPNFFAFKPHARRTIQLWNVTLICLLMLGFMAQLGDDYSRGWIVLFYFVALAGLIVDVYKRQL